MQKEVDMSEKSVYKLWRDDDGHWYVIPVEIEAQVFEWDEASRKFWQFGWKEEDAKEPKQPEGMIELGCGYSAVHFKEFEIDC